MEFVLAFVIGGALCAVAQVILDAAKLQPAYVMVMFVSLGAVASGLGWYGPLVKLAGAGATIPLSGFGHSLVQGVAEDVMKKGAVGLLTGGLTATSLGFGTAILFAWLMSVIFNPRG